jgi:alkylation response protein AidB-like acyl-CoA dehydrogenase
MNAVVAASAAVLSDDLIQACGERAALYDRENRFFTEDFEELRQAGYLLSAVPQQFGGRGLSLAEVCQEQRRLAYRSAPTALAINMHLYWTGVAADLYRAGDTSLQWLLEEAAAGEIFAAGHGEAGNDLPLLYSSARADRTEGGYCFTGRKMFGSLSPVWTRFGIHAMDLADPSAPKVVHAFIQRDTPGFEIKDNWDTLGMRATRSNDTILDAAFVPDRYVARVLAPDFLGADLFVLSIFAWAEPTFGNIYLGIAERARDLAIAGCRKRTSVAGLSRSMAYHPEVQHAIAALTLELEGAIPHVDRIAEDWSNGVGHGGAWPMKLVAAKHHCVESAKRVVDLAMEVSGGTGMFKTNELERLYRDVRCGGFHPANSALVHEIVGKTMLGVLGEAGPRWG